MRNTSRKNNKYIRLRNNFLPNLTCWNNNVKYIDTIVTKFLETVKKFANFFEISATPETSSIIISQSSFLFLPNEIFTLSSVVSSRDLSLKDSSKNLSKVKESSSSCSFAT